MAQIQHGAKKRTSLKMPTSHLRYHPGPNAFINFSLTLSGGAWTPKNLRLAAIRPVLYDQTSVRVPPVVLTTARHAPPVALLLVYLLLSPCFVGT